MREPMGTLWKTALYERLSREDGDRAESDSIKNQRNYLLKYIDDHPDMILCKEYSDDGYTGTNFDRPSFQQMLRDIEAGEINCIVVKDLSRFGRDYIDAGQYLERWLPEHGVRFIAINDQIDSLGGSYDMMMPLRNLFNAQYAKDISLKVKSAMKTKQLRGEFVGAFASYGYCKDPADHNHLIVDPVAGKIVQRIFSMFENGSGKIRIARLLNDEGIPCPSEYKRLMGEKYHNRSRLERTTYWTYSSIHHILQNQMYIGNMEQAKSDRKQMHGKAKAKDKSQWIVVEGTHEPLIDKAQWDRVQSLIRSNGKDLDFKHNVSPFAGFLKCADCGRSMAKTTYKGKDFFTCGSYKHYGAQVCSKHYITKDEVEQVVLTDLNQIVASVSDLHQLAQQNMKQKKTNTSQRELDRLETALGRVQRMMQGSYEDYKDKLISREEYLRYRKDYEGQEKTLKEQISKLAAPAPQRDLLHKPWIEELVRLGKLTALDRATVAETVKEIRVFEDGSLEITYRFSEELRVLLETDENTTESV